MQGRKYINLEEIGIVVLKIQKAEFGKFTVPVNNTLECHTSSFVFLATDTLLCALILFEYVIWLAVVFGINSTSSAGKKIVQSAAEHYHSFHICIASTINSKYYSKPYCYRLIQYICNFWCH